MCSSIQESWCHNSSPDSLQRKEKETEKSHYEMGSHSQVSGIQEPNGKGVRTRRISSPNPIWTIYVAGYAMIFSPTNADSEDIRGYVFRTFFGHLPAKNWIIFHNIKLWKHFILPSRSNNHPVQERMMMGLLKEESNSRITFRNASDKSIVDDHDSRLQKIALTRTTRKKLTNVLGWIVEDKPASDFEQASSGLQLHTYVKHW